MTKAHTLAGLAECSNKVAAWVAEVQELTHPDKVHWCDGSAAEMQLLR